MRWLPQPARATILAFVAMLLAAAPVSGASYPSGFEERTLVSGLSGPTAVAWAPDGRMFISEKAGRLKVVPAEGGPATTILDISGQVNSYWDRGLLGMAVDSSFASNGYLYLLYTYELNQLSPDGSGPMVSRLSRVTVGSDNAVSAESVLLGSYVSGPCPAPSNTVDCIPSDGISHSIGSVRSAPDGTLWVGSGDAASFSVIDPLAFRTYDEQSFAGKIVHVDRDGRGLPEHPVCPSDADLDHVCTKLHSKGFRNPFRFKLRPDGSLTVGDVGANTREEVDLIRAGGKSYGWPCYEGTIRTPGYRNRSECLAEYAKGADAHEGPAYDYPHNGSSAVLGGPTYTGDQYPAGYRDEIFFADYGAGFIKHLTVDSDDHPTSVQDFATGWAGVDLEPAPNGDLTSVVFGDGSPGTGSILRIVYAPGNSTPAAVAAATPTSGDAPLTVQLTGSGSSDPDGDQLSYDWDFGDGSASSSEANPSHTYSDPGSKTVTLTVDDGRGRTDTDTILISVGGAPPVATIEAPADESLYRDGQTVALRGSATDPQDGTLPASALDWEVTINHAGHTHPVMQVSGVASTSFEPVRDHDADSHYEIKLTAMDSEGLKAQHKIQIRPETVPFTIDSSPAAAPISYGGTGTSAPFSTRSAIGFVTTVSAADRFSSGGKTYAFEGWSDGGARSHDITIPDGASTLTVTYKEIVDKALGRSATASSSESPGLEPDKAVDGDASTRWSSSYADDQWWQVDLGSGRQVDGVELDWEFAYASRYKILTSLDGVNFAQAADVSILGPGLEATTFPARLARYVRVEGLDRGTIYGISFWDARVYGPPDPPPPPDTTPPDTTITDGPSGTTTSTSASFDFSSDESGSSFECRLDGGDWAACSSPKDYGGLSDGSHTFEVRATDAAGNLDPSPASRTWTVKAAYRDAVLGTAGLTSYWRLGELSGSTAADSKGTNNGTYLGPALGQPGALTSDPDKSAGFDGTDDYVRIPDFAPPADLTLEAWIYPQETATGNNRILVDKGNSEYDLRIDSGGKLLFTTGNPVQTATDDSFNFHTPTGANRWYHVAVTFDSAADTVRFYRNGALTKTVAGFTAQVQNTTFALRIGRHSQFNFGTFNGRLDEVALYNTALTGATVLEHYQAGTGGS